MAASHTTETPASPVTVTLHGLLNRFLPDHRSTARVDLAQPSTARRLLEDLEVPVEMLSLLLLNNERISTEALVAPGDFIEAFPVCGGGSSGSRAQRPENRCASA